MLIGLKNAPTMFSRIFIVTLWENIHKFMEVYMYHWIVYSILKAFKIAQSDVWLMQVVTNFFEYEEVYFFAYHLETC